MFPFTVTSGGKDYACERVVTGTRALQQVICVIGVGSKADSAHYGSGGHPTDSMQSVAGLIAHEIIRENPRNQGVR